MIRVIRVLAAATCLLAACATEGTTTMTTSPTTTTTVAPTTTTAAPVLPPSLQGLETMEITIAAAGEETDPLLVVVADDEGERQQGLMRVTDLLDVDGMLFVFPGDTGIGFWMKNTLIPLDIAFFAADGALVDVLTMEPCQADPCPVYRPGGDYRFAVEAARGAFTGLAGSEVLGLGE